MSDFEEYIKVNYPRDYERQKRIYPDQSVEELYSEDYKMWQHQQAIINDLKAQLECCRKENAVLLGKVGELQERINTTKSSQSKLHKTEIGDCLHFSTTMFHEGKATCFECDAVVNHKREVIGVMQTRTLRGEHD